MEFILDFETWGTDIFSAAIVDCSYTLFDRNRFLSDPYEYDELLEMVQTTKFSLRDQKAKGYGVCKRTLNEFWAKQPPEVLSRLKPKETDLTLDEASIKILKYLKDGRGEGKIKYWWSRNNKFDPPLLERIMNDTGRRRELDGLLPYYGLQDVKTHINTAFHYRNKRDDFCPLDDTEEWKRKFKPHASNHDIVGDVLRLQRIHIFQNG